MRETLHVAIRDGRSSAKITLRPAELGEVRIRITYGSSGVTASMSTDSTRAAQILSQAGGELRQALEEHGLTVQGLDVQVGAEHRDAARDTDPDPAPGSRAKAALTPDDLVPDTPTPVIGPPQLGVSIDVLA